jgi:hypothetical protein
MLNTSFFRGYFRGALLNATQFVTNMAHPLFYSRGNGYIAHFVYSSIFEALTFPLDTVKTLLYADVHRRYANVFDCV